MIELPFKIQASDSDISMSIYDENLGDKIEFNAIFSDNEFARVRVKLKRVVGAKISPFGGDPDNFSRIGIVPNSPWLSEIAFLKDKYSPGSSLALAELKHFYFRGNDSTVDVICSSFTWERI